MSTVYNVSNSVYDSSIALFYGRISARQPTLSIYLSPTTSAANSIPCACDIRLCAVRPNWNELPHTQTTQNPRRPDEMNAAAGDFCAGFSRTRARGQSLNGLCVSNGVDINYFPLGEYGHSMWGWVHWERIYRKRALYLYLYAVNKTIIKTKQKNCFTMRN